MHRLARSFAVALLLALAAPVCGAQAAAPRRPLRIVYYYPADRPPLPGYQKRLDAAMRNVQGFYAEWMDRHGWGRRSFGLETGANGLVVVHLAPGKLRLAEHKRGQTDDEMMRDVDRAMRAEGLDPGRETTVVFSNLLIWDGAVAKEAGPYWGGGGPNSGRCCVYDDPLLDPARLGSKEPGGYYGHPCSIGEFNSHYIGGIAHELGHALGLPHDAEAAADRRTLGSSLMGGGNHTYGRDLRGEGPGTFLTAADAMILAKHPLFRDDGRAAGGKASATCETLSVSQRDAALVVSGQVAGSPRPFGVVAYSDPKGGDDYDAISAAARTDEQGRFRLELPDLRPGERGFRLKACHEDGNVSELVNTPFVVDGAGRADTGSIEVAVAWSGVSSALERGDKAGVSEKLRGIRSRYAGDAESLRRCALVEAWQSPAKPVAADGVAAGTRRIAVSDLAFESATVGWGQPLRDRVLQEGARMPFIQAGGAVYAKGLFAHAPAAYAFRLGGKWSTLEGLVGVAADAGSVVFVVRGDGRELWRSGTIRPGPAQRFSVDIKGVYRLEVVTEDAGDGRSSDWGVWADTYVQR